MRLPGRYYTWRFRTENLVLDLLDKLRGVCAHKPSGSPREPYYFWRCGLRRGHDGRHRSVNYEWDEHGSEYLPIADPPRGCDRRPTLTRSQRKAREAEFQRMDQLRHLRCCVPEENHHYYGSGERCECGAYPNTGRSIV